MLPKSSRPVIYSRILAAPINRMDHNPRTFDLGAVGLGIVAALEKPGNKNALFARNLSRSNPAPVRPEEDYTALTPFRTSTRGRGGVFHISPAIIGDAAGVPPPDFLSACNLCRKGLLGVDIYMYRGEKAFCSPECRYREMAMDERAEKCSSEATSSPSYVNGQILTNGILAI